MNEADPRASSTTSQVRSMTGQGHATEQGPLGVVSVELRTVNNRGFKCSPRLSDSLSSLESKIEGLARTRIHRGTVHLAVSWRRPAGQNLPQIDTDVLHAYVDQLAQLREMADQTPTSIDLATLMTLPGVIGSTREDRRDDQQLHHSAAGSYRGDRRVRRRGADGRTPVRRCTQRQRRCVQR